MSMWRIAVLGLMLAGCAQGAPNVPPPPPQRPGSPVVVMPPAPPVRPGDEAVLIEPATPCRIAAVAALVGKPFTPALQADALARVGARSVRVIRPDTAVTMDYRPDRLNIDIDRERIVRGFRCG